MPIAESAHFSNSRTVRHTSIAHVIAHVIALVIAHVIAHVTLVYSTRDT